MAEEIVYRWDHPTDLVLEVMGTRTEGTAPSRHALWGLLANPDLVARHRFRLMDTTGRDVEFPLALVSDTDIRTDSGADFQTYQP
ncbi:MAG: hypothetical protein OXQ29_08585 [Rhodospirillaceae bacterium]|nr:hypothetical protein [Rhodospirillaceae bacterium]